MNRQIPIGWIVASLGLLGLGLMGADQPTPRGETSVSVSRQLARLTGGHTRVVWAQVGPPVPGASEPTSPEICSSEPVFHLRGLDSADGKGERAILSALGSYFRPLLTDDGRWVVYTDKARCQVRVVGFDGKGDRLVVEGWACDVWRDPASKFDWVYVRTGKGEHAAPIRRYRLDKPSECEGVWDKGPLDHSDCPWLQLSADGKMAATAWPWPNCGLIDLPSGQKHDRQGGCWPGICPDNTYRSWVFEGEHLGVTIFDGDGKNPRSMSFKEAPGVGDRDVYFPRWSNRPLVLAISGPGIGGPDCEVLIGRMDGKLTKVEAWVKLTSNKVGDYYPDVWVE